MRWIESIALVSTAVLLLDTARACGPEFPLFVISSRHWVLSSPSSGSFAAELQKILEEPGDTLPVAESWNDTTENAESQGVSPGIASKIQRMRGLQDGYAAYAAGAGLPAAIRLYTAGAVSFHHDDLEGARRRFEAVLALPGKEPEPRAVWARFMLGRMAASAGALEAAARHFSETRSLVRSGLPDPLGLAVASLGEEARLHLRPGGIAKAVALYVRQASYGSEGAVASLREVLSAILDDPRWLHEGVGDRLTRRLLVAFLHGRDSYYDWDPEPEGDLTRLLDALQGQGLLEMVGASRLAAVAYEQGRYELAERLVRFESNALSLWIGAKLAMRAGDMERALAAYSKAAASFEPANGESETLCQIQAEQGILRLARSEYVQALQLFYDSAERSWAGDARSTDFWTDVAHLAERVLTIDELQKFVDENLEAPTPGEMDAAFESGREVPAAELRGLLARRLMRAGRGSEALRYFDDEYVRSAAEEYVNALSQAHSRWRGSVTRAEAWYTAATIARFDGMEILGTELQPDFAVWDGNFEMGPFFDAYAREEYPAPESTPEGEEAVRSPYYLVSEDEQNRMKRSAAEPDLRFHYRFTATEHASRSADLVPASSEAFAAILCKAASWIIVRHPEKAAPLYRRYLREGPYLLWAKHFGRRCPEPDFDAASSRLWEERAGAVRVFVRRNAVWLGAASALFLAALGYVLRARLQHWGRRLRNLRGSSSAD